ncbi:hypothetical protein KY358_04855, partial [Candidatus Woesearchaeota archaeon]|nr:hypothetical protein [Candidatus Woesearchaeota archaeon]
EAKNALIELNLSAQDLNELKPEQQFEVIADALKGVENQADKVRLAMKLFDSEGVSLLQTMTEGAAGLRDMRAEANALGLTLSQEDATGAAAAKDAFARLQASVSGLGLAMARTLGPSLADVADWLRVEIPRAVHVAKTAYEEFLLSFSGIEEAAIRPADELNDRVAKLTARIALMRKTIESPKTQPDIAENFKIQIVQLEPIDS